MNILLLTLLALPPSVDSLPVDQTSDTTIAVEVGEPPVPSTTIVEVGESAELPVTGGGLTLIFSIVAAIAVSVGVLLRRIGTHV